ncbi:hypothetical protein OSB04_012577 [Centaurea solstitialis]|uniref:galactinol--sucrose galactosyltransferase n=1 Tax=Centaurea solstitialis TaxID=347529 RepID=A0AA38TWD1_9ASTR|nr:hypothetical protein OSB04_012577 [Centaurea solstitialis]
MTNYRSTRAILNNSQLARIPTQILQDTENKLQRQRLKKASTMATMIHTPNLISISPSLSSHINSHPTLASISSTIVSHRFPLITSNSYRNRRTFISSRTQKSESVLDYVEEEEEDTMTIGSVVQISGRRLVAKDRTILTDVAENVITSSGSDSGHANGAFIGAVFDDEKSRHVVSLGKLHDVRFMACFRFKLWWMAQKMGNKGSEIPLETQFLLMETVGGSEKEKLYVVFLPLIEESFRACLQGNPGDELEVCLESGDSETKGSGFSHAVYVGVGTDPFVTITDAICTVRSHLETFRQRQDKKSPGILDCFGWCTWDAFYQDVTQEGVESGLKSLAEGGTPAKFVIIDDGWQSVEGDLGSKSEKPLMRLTGIKENQKFRSENEPAIGIKNIVDIAKQKYGLKYVYVWHAIVGYWGGVRPGAEGMEGYEAVMKYPKVSKGVVENEPGWKTDMLAVQGLGLMNPEKVFDFYDDMHRYLASAGVDGVKVDVQSILETLGTGSGGRVSVTQQYHRALDASVARNFPDNGCIACMSHNTDSLYCSQQTAVIRASDDFYPLDPVSHTIHIASVAYNSVFLGEFMQPDWDMFHSLHPAAEYHASARAISGGPIYVSDAPGKHNFDLLKKLVLPDGSVLRARLPGRPTKDCLFTDPARDGVSLLKIWNMNKYTGVLGVYNCQGAAWNAIDRQNTFHHTQPDAITGFIRAHDVHLIADAAVGPGWSGNCAVYRHHAGDLATVPQNAVIPVSLNILEHEIFTVTPIEVLGSGLGFGPLGLIEMFNGGGAIEEVMYLVEREGGLASVSMKVKGCGRFGSYSMTKPRRCMVGASEVEFLYDSQSGLLSFSLNHMPQVKKYHDVTIHLKLLFIVFQFSFSFSISIFNCRPLLVSGHRHRHRHRRRHRRAYCRRRPPPLPPPPPATAIATRRHRRRHATVVPFLSPRPPSPLSPPQPPPPPPHRRDHPLTTPTAAAATTTIAPAVFAAEATATTPEAPEATAIAVEATAIAVEATAIAVEATATIAIAAEATVTTVEATEATATTVVAAEATATTTTASATTTEATATPALATAAAKPTASAAAAAVTTDAATVAIFGKMENGK